NREARNAMHKLTMEIYRPELERRLEETWRQCYAPRGDGDAAADAEPDLHSACTSDSDPIPSPHRGEGQGEGVFDPSEGVSSSDEPARRPPHPNPLPGGEREQERAAILHSACMSDPGYDPATVLPTPRRRAVNRLRAEVARQAAAPQ